MAAQSTLKGLTTDLTNNYLKHRPAYQRLLMTSFTLYVVGSTYRGLNPKRKPKKAAAAGGAPAAGKEVAPVVDEKASSGMDKGGKGGRKRKRAPRVEVRWSSPRFETDIRREGADSRCCAPRSTPCSSSD